MQRRRVALEYELDDADDADNAPIEPGSLEAAVLAAAIANYEAMFSAAGGRRRWRVWWRTVVSGAGWCGVARVRAWPIAPLRQ